MCIITSFLILTAVIIIISSIGICKCCSNNNDSFKDIYSNWGKKIQELKDTFGIGEPGGVLTYEPNKACDTKDTNDLVQSNVAFKPVAYKDGCTVVKKKWP